VWAITQTLTDSSARPTHFSQAAATFEQMMYSDCFTASVFFQPAETSNPYPTGTTDETPNSALWAKACERDEEAADNK
jgi:hypothetical protein